MLLEYNTTTPKSVHAFIICWSGKEDSARHIAEAIQHSVEYLTVIYSTKTDTLENGAGDWVKVPDEWYYGKKCEKSLQLLAGNIMLHITADTETDDWPKLVSRCKSIHAQYDSIGIWAPDIDFTDWNTKTVKIADIKDSGLALVAQTDSIIWSLAPPVIKRLRELDYDCNNLGWGIDWLAISYAAANNFLVVRDMSIKIKHPKGTGYSGSLASKQMQTFLAQMTPQEKVQFALLNAFTIKTTPQSLKKILKQTLKTYIHAFKTSRQSTPPPSGLSVTIPHPHNK